MVQTLERPRVQSAASSRRRRLGYFGWHFVEMCAAMCGAWMLVAVPFVAVAKAAGVGSPVQDLPELATLLAAAAMSVGMAAQMRWRRHDWRCIGEMAGAMAIEAALLISLAAAGVFPRANLFVAYHGLMPVAMVVAMLYRRDLYTRSPNGAHGHA